MEASTQGLHLEAEWKKRPLERKGGSAIFPARLVHREQIIYANWPQRQIPYGILKNYISRRP